MKVLCIGDGHLKATRMDLVSQFIAWLDKVIPEINPDMIVYTGDYMDNHAIIRCEIMSMFYNHLRKNKHYKKYYIIGNHDQYLPNSNKYHALQTMKNVFDDFVVVDNIIELNGMTFVPFMHNMSEFPINTQPIVFAHQTFIGADYGYTKTDSGVNADDIKAEIIISGHIHKRQSFGKVIYPGSPFAQSVNDIDQPKGIMIFDTDTYKYSFVECPLPMWYGIKCELSQDSSIADIHQYIESVIDDINYFILDIQGPKAEIISYLDSKQFLTLKNGKNIRTRASYTDTNKERVKIQAVTMDDIIASYVTQVYSGSLIKEDIITKALEIKQKVTT